MDEIIKIKLREAILNEMGELGDCKKKIIYEQFSENYIKSCVIIVKGHGLFRIYQSYCYSTDSIGTKYMACSEEMFEAIKNSMS